ncbi:MAG: hypothetical protein C9356_15070 [Oleiphilus sp.]|nr:MAG: hypothetical protein C9356_15070 [Oleiphilus sp.]
MIDINGIIHFASEKAYAIAIQRLAEQYHPEFLRYFRGEYPTITIQHGNPQVFRAIEFVYNQMLDIADLSRSWYLFFDTETDYRGNASDLNLRAYFGNQHVIYDGESVLQRYAIPVDVYRDQEKLSEWVGYVPASIAHQDIRQTAMEDIYKEIRAR